MKVPGHVGIIPDGNRRLAKRLMSKPWKGHEWGLEKIRDIVDWCKELEIKVVTFYLLSLENFKRRPKRELEFLFRLARKEIVSIMEDENHTVHRNRVRMSFFGRLELLPKDLQESIVRVTEKTKNYSGLFVNLAIAYGGRQEIVNASRMIAYDVRKGILNPSQINESLLRQYFWTNGFPDPDLVIRTGGEKRLSNFLTFQSTYSELVFIDKFWPDFEKGDFFRAIKEFGKRQRRFGK